MCIQQLQNQTAQLINLEFLFHFIHIHVCMRTRSWRWDTQAELSLPSRPKGVLGTARNCVNVGQKVCRHVSLATSKACLNALIFMASFDSAIVHISFVGI